MTVADSTSRSGPYAGAGQTGPFVIGFRFLADSHLEVIKTSSTGVETTLAQGSDWTAIGAGDASGGELTLLAALAVGYTLTIQRNVPITQEADYTQSDAFPAQSHEDALDKLTMIAQQTDDKVSRSIRIPESGSTLSELPVAAERAGMLVGFDSSGDAVAVAPTSGSAAALALDLVSTNAASKAAGQLGMARSLAYPAATVGRLLNGLPVSALEFHTGTVGVQADDLAAVSAALTALRTATRGTLIIPANFHKSFATPALGLSNSQSLTMIDLRTDRPNTGTEGFGKVSYYVEGRDSSGNYATEMEVKGKQNPAFVAHSLSDGTANGYSKVNKASSFLHKANGVDQWQMLNDPLFKGYFDWALIYFAGSTGKYGLRVGIDANSKPRFDFAPALIGSASKAITGATNATPIVITAVGHGISGANSPVTIASVGGNTAANGDWQVTVLTNDTFELNGSVGSGAYTSGGTAAVQANAQRATMVVPPIQGGTEAAVFEGKAVSTVALGTVPFPTTSQTADVNLHARPYVLNITGTQQNNGVSGSGGAKIVIGNVSLVAGTATVTLTGDAVFTTSSSYKCTANDITAANAVKVTRTSASQITFTGTGTDSIDFIAVGF